MGTEAPCSGGYRDTGDCNRRSVSEVQSPAVALPLELSADLQIDIYEEDFGADRFHHEIYLSDVRRSG